MKERLKAVGWSLLFLVGGYGLFFPVFVLFDTLLRGTSAGSLAETALQAFALLIGYGLMTWFIGVKALGFGASDLFGSAVHRFHRLKGFSWGLMVGGALAALAMLVAVLMGQAAWKTDGGTVAQWLATLVLTGAVMLPAAAAEEVMFRGVPLLALTRGFGRIPAMVSLATLFAFMHGLNPGVGTLALVNIGLAGIFLSLAFFTPGRLWTSTGAHLGWNLAIAALAAPVSGIPLPMPWLDYSPGGPAWLTGGAFGPEGGILASLGILGGAFLASRRAQRIGAQPV